MARVNLMQKAKYPRKGKGPRVEIEPSPEDQEIRQILHRLWWKTRQRNLARLQATVTSNKEIPA